MIEDAIRHFFRSISCAIYGKWRVNAGKSIKHVACIDWGAYADHPHAHILIEAPSTMTNDDFTVLIESKANRIRLINRERKISRYLDENGSGYLVKHGIGRMVVSLISSSNHS